MELLSVILITWKTPKWGKRSEASLPPRGFVAASQQAQLVCVLCCERVSQWQGQGNLWAECCACSLEFLCALFSSSHLSPRDVQPSTLCSSKRSLTFAWEVLSFIPGKSGHGKREKSCDGGLVLCDRCTAASLLLRIVQKAFVELLEQSQHWAIPTWKVRTEHSGATYTTWAGWITVVGLVVLSLTPSHSMSCSRATAVSLHGLYLLFLLQISPKVWPAASFSSPFQR